MRRIGLFLSTTAVVLLVVGAPVMADSQLRNPVPADSEQVELAIGIVSGLAGGWVGFWGTFTILHAILEAQAIMDSGLSSGIAAYVIGVPLGSAIGSWSGVIGTGWVLEDEGNKALAFLGAVIGASLGFLPYLSVPPLGYFALSISAAAGATIGYHFEEVTASWGAAADSR